MARRKRRQWGSGSVFQRDGRWWIRWREAGKRKCKSFTEKSIAEAVLTQIMRNVQMGEAGLPSKPEAIPTLDELAGQWLDARRATHRSARDDRARWTLHLAPRFGRLKPDELEPAQIRTAVEAWLAEGLAAATCQRTVALLSSFYSDLTERRLAKSNPAKGLPRATRRLLRSTHDPKTTPFVEKLADVQRIYRALPDPVNLAYAIGAMAGLRVGELLALQWSSVDLERRRIVVSEQVQNGQIFRPKDLDARVVPIVDSLLPVLQAARLKSGGAGQVVPAMRGGCRKRLDPHTLGKSLRRAFEALNKEAPTLPSMTWYQATRHTFASQWVINGGSLEKLKEAMGHSSVLVTERYAHLRGDVFSPADLGRVAVDFSAPTGKVLPLRGGEIQNGRDVATAQEVERSTG